ncbi:MAG: ATP-binding cassette domain-containing protein [Clostridia bacterium]|nr:ATP-binding cassette domain-containing protein [Clostridia bacterium]
MILTINNVTKSFGEKSVLKEISFSAESGTAVGVLGRNGAGKTTLIRIIMNVFGADSGNVTLDGNPISTQKVRIGYLPEERGLYPKKKIIEQLVYFAELQNIDKKTAIQNAEILLRRLEIEEYKNRRLDTLSKGNQQKVQLVATLIADPDIIILDEPFSGLDPVNASLLKDLVKDLIKNGKLVLFSSHQMNYIEEFCDEILILNGGEIVLSGGIKEIKRGYARNIIEIKTDNIKTISEFLNNGNFDFIKRITCDDEKIIVTLTDENQKDKLMDAVSQFGNLIDGFSVKEPTLNEIFVAFTEGQI